MQHGKRLYQVQEGVMENRDDEVFEELQGATHQNGLIVGVDPAIPGTDRTGCRIVKCIEQVSASRADGANRLTFHEFAIRTVHLPERDEILLYRTLGALIRTITDHLLERTL
jgi:hypothetical protein